MKRKFFLVTGGAGFIGRSLVRSLLARGHRVRVFDDGSRGHAAGLADVAGRIELLEGDVRDPQAVARAVAGVDSVCHLAFVNGTKFFYTKPELVLEVGVKGTLNVLDACRAHGVREFAFASSSEVYQSAPRVPADESTPLSVPDPLNPRYSYGAGKIIGEVLAINYGRAFFDRVLIFRPHNVYGEDMGWEHVIPEFSVRLARMARERSGTLRFPIQGHGEETRAFVHIDDFTAGLALVIEKGEHLGIYHIGTSEEISIRGLAEAVAANLGRRIEVVPGRPAPGSAPRRCPDISKLAALGYRPRHTLATGLPPVVKWYAERADQAPAPDS